MNTCSLNMHGSQGRSGPSQAEVWRWLASAVSGICKRSSLAVSGNEPSSLPPRCRRRRTAACKRWGHRGVSSSETWGLGLNGLYEEAERSSLRRRPPKVAKHRHAATYAAMAQLGVPFQSLVCVIAFSQKQLLVVFANTHFPGFVETRFCLFTF